MMTAGDTIAFAALVVGIISVCGFLAEAYKRRIDFKQRELELMAQHTAEKAAQYAAQAERLEQRVRVLERLATDHGGAVAAQIEALRDPVVN